MKKLIPAIILCFTIISIISCESSSRKLPILGEREFINGDSVYHTIPDFSFVNQDN